MFDCRVLCVYLYFVSCNKAICMLLVCMKCVNFTILYLILSILSCSVFYYWESDAGGLFGGEGRAVEVGLEEESDVPILAVCDVAGS